MNCPARTQCHEFLCTGRRRIRGGGGGGGAHAHDHRFAVHMAASLSRNVRRGRVHQLDSILAPTTASICAHLRFQLSCVGLFALRCLLAIRVDFWPLHSFSSSLCKTTLGLTSDCGAVDYGGAEFVNTDVLATYRGARVFASIFSWSAGEPIHDAFGKASCLCRKNRR